MYAYKGLYIDTNNYMKYVFTCILMCYLCEYMPFCKVRLELPRGKTFQKELTYCFYYCNDDDGDCGCVDNAEYIDEDVDNVCNDDTNAQRILIIF